MRKIIVLVILVVVAGCSQASPTPAPTDAPFLTPTPETFADTTVSRAASATTDDPTPVGVADETTPEDVETATQTVPFLGGGIFLMGSSESEIEAVLALCEPDEGCDEAAAGDALPGHQVMVGPYQIELYEVSNAQYANFLNALGPDSHARGCLDAQCIATNEDDAGSNITFDGAQYAPVAGAENLPVTHVSWYGAQAYCLAFDRRLPTEAEWELAARGGGSLYFPWGNDFDPALANTARTEAQGLAPVDAYPEGVSPYGVFNLAGNVAEWTLDWYASDFYASEAATQADPTGPASGTRRVVRGGSWQDAPLNIRAASRAALEPDAMLDTVGFRCAVEGWPPPTPPDASITARYDGIERGALEDGAPYLGAPDAPVVLTEFFQFTCPHCNSFRETLHELLPYVRDGQLQIVARPLRSSSQLSVPPMFLAMCAAEQGAYWPAADYFFDGYFVEEGGIAYTFERLMQRAEALGLDMEAMNACVNDEARMTAIQNTFVRSSELAGELGVSGVPTILINGAYITNEQGQPMSGALPLATVQAAIDAALNAEPGGE
ncbi:MAG: hypothetical protein Kow00120_20860 [Anaerolineae bacterium]